MQPQPLPALVAAFALLVYVVVGFYAGRMRARHGVPAPSMDGPEEFLRAMRVQANTLEQIVLFLPALALFTVFQGGFWAAVIGAFWPLGRIHYAFSYMRDPRTRGPGFLLALASSLVLLIGGAVGAVTRLL